MAAGAVQRIAHVVRQQGFGLQVQAHAAHHLIGIRGRQQIGQTRRDEGRGVRGVRVQLLAQAGHLRRIDRRCVVAPAAANKTQDLGDFIIGQPGKTGHGPDPWMRCGLCGLPAGQGDVQQGGRVGGGDAGVAVEGREHAFDPAAVRAMAVRAKLRVTETATGGEQRIGCFGGLDGHCRHGQVILAGGQRLEVTGDRCQVRIGEMLGAVVDHVGHVARHRGKTVLPGLEQLNGVFHGPQITQAQGSPRFNRLSRQVMLATAARIAEGFFLKGQPTRRVTRSAMPQPLHQVGTAIEHLASGRVRREGLVVDEHPVPQRQAPALVEREAHFSLQIHVLDRCHTLHQVRVQRAHVVISHLGVGRVRHGRVEILACRGHAFTHHFVELFKTVLTDSGLGVRRDVAGIDRAHRRVQFQPASHDGPALGGVAGNTVTELRHVQAALHHIGVGLLTRISCRFRLAGPGVTGVKKRQADRGQTRKLENHGDIPLRHRPGVVPSARAVLVFCYELLTLIL